MDKQNFIKKNSDKFKFSFQLPAFALQSRAGDVYPVEKRDFLDTAK